VPLETVPLLAGRPDETVPLLGALPAAVVCATRVLLSGRSEEASVIAVTGEEASVIVVTGEESTIVVIEEVGSASEVDGRSVMGPVAEARVVPRSQVEIAVSVSRALQSKLLELEASTSAVVDGAAVADAW
jgi:hypothetical protein